MYVKNEYKGRKWGNFVYNKKVMDHFMNPRNVGEIENADGVGEAGNPHGDQMKIFLKIRDNRIEDVKFKTFGCGGAISSSSLTTEKIKGKTLDEALALKNSEIVEELDMPKAKIHCSVMAEQAIKAAVEDYRKKNK